MSQNDFIEITWSQNEANLTVIFPTGTSEAKFYIDDNCINFLAGNTPKTFFITIDHPLLSKETKFFINFEGIKANISKENALKIKVGKPIKNKSNIPVNAIKKGKYCIERGEAFQERFLSDSGWQAQRSYFDLYEVVTNTANEIKQEVKSEPPKIEVQNKKEPVIKQTGKLKECIKCSEIIPSNLTVCPYCNASQVSIDEDSVDISI